MAAHGARSRSRRAGCAARLARAPPMAATVVTDHCVSVAALDLETHVLDAALRSQHAELAPTAFSARPASSTALRSRVRSGAVIGAANSGMTRLAGTRWHKTDALRFRKFALARMPQGVQLDGFKREDIGCAFARPTRSIRRPCLPACSPPEGAASSLEHAGASRVGAGCGPPAGPVGVGPAQRGGEGASAASRVGLSWYQSAARPLARSGGTARGRGRVAPRPHSASAHRPAVTQDLSRGFR
jgi:hypothetical protein